ncbi:DsrE family protein [Methylophilus sp. 14]|uniref:DsrE family protein n=1 Tax=Methylophilus sp. 14 TaxID=2781019 RepID=UPI00188E114B|nr:DsrE family protein [Methylophilus sp. 14]MBF4988151.1 DsrE family protein [Methylophilus sp. 14]
MKRSLLTMVFALLFAQTSIALEDPFERNRLYVGAEATKGSYKAIYQIDSNNPDVIKKAIRNIKNLIEDPRLKGKVEVELVAFSGGTELLLKTSEYEAALRELITKGVVIVQCLNTLKERKLERSQFFDFVGFVPSANGELVIRGGDGWVIIKP